MRNHIQWSQLGNFPLPFETSRRARLGAEMIAIMAVTALCTASIVFYLRFLVELCKECKHPRICYLVRLHRDSDECPILETPKVGRSSLRAA